MFISKTKKCFIMKSSTYYFHLKTKILADFQICISVPLSTHYINCKKLTSSVLVGWSDFIQMLATTKKIKLLYIFLTFNH